jgi:hypothetical protein
VVASGWDLVRSRSGKGLVRGFVPAVYYSGWLNRAAAFCGGGRRPGGVFPYGRFAERTVSNVAANTWGHVRRDSR